MERSDAAFPSVFGGWKPPRWRSIYTEWQANQCNVLWSRHGVGIYTHDSTVALLTHSLKDRGLIPPGDAGGRRKCLSLSSFWHVLVPKLVQEKKLFLELIFIAFVPPPPEFAFGSVLLLRPLMWYSYLGLIRCCVQLCMIIKAWPKEYLQRVCFQDNVTWRKK